MSRTNPLSSHFFIWTLFCIRLNFFIWTLFCIRLNYDWTLFWICFSFLFLGRRLTSATCAESGTATKPTCGNMWGPITWQNFAQYAIRWLQHTTTLKTLLNAKYNTQSCDKFYNEFSHFNQLSTMLNQVGSKYNIRHCCT